MMLSLSDDYIMNAEKLVPEIEEHRDIIFYEIRISNDLLFF